MRFVVFVVVAFVVVIVVCCCCLLVGCWLFSLCVCVFFVCFFREGGGGEWGVSK